MAYWLNYLLEYLEDLTNATDQKRMVKGSRVLHWVIGKRRTYHE